MTKEKEFDWLCRLRSEIYVFMPKEWLIPMNNALDMAIKDLKQEPKWIPVSERLPENRNQEVLISLEWGIDIGRYSDGEWHSEWINHFDDGNVLAWMPLPKPYEPQESEGKGMTNEQAKSELMQIYMSLSEEKKKALDVAFQAMEQSMPTMVYPQVDGITPTVVAQADGEKTCGTCRNEDTYHCAECENKSDYEQSQADGEYILKSEAIRVASGYCHPSNIAKELRKLPSVAIPSAEPKPGQWILLDECSNSGYYCSECHKKVVKEGWSNTVKKIKYCPNCGARMFEPQESEDKE